MYCESLTPKSTKEHLNPILGDFKSEHPRNDLLARSHRAYCSLAAVFVQRVAYGFMTA